MALVERSQLMDNAEIFRKESGDGPPFGENCYARDANFVRSCDTLNKKKTLRNIEVTWTPVAIALGGSIEAIVRPTEVYRI